MCGGGTDEIMADVSNAWDYDFPIIFTDIFYALIPFAHDVDSGEQWSRFLDSHH